LPSSENPPTMQALNRPDPSIPAPTIHRFVLGDFQTNCYVVAVPPAPECWIVDCGYRPDQLLDFIRDQQLKPTRLILTHAHCDHMAGVERALSRFPGLPVACHAAEHAFCTDPGLNLSAFFPPPVTCSAPTESLAEGDVLELSSTKWNVWHTPGHSPGGICLLHQDSQHALVGDTLFRGSMGRIDFPTSNRGHMGKSLARLLTLDDAFAIHPGHGESTTIGHERATNPFLRGLTTARTS
jgi:hydroxyacylglutathione hydrolase